MSGYNCATFDAPRLFKFFKDLDVFLPCHPQTPDLIQLLFWYLEMNPSDRPFDLKLETVCQHFGVKLETAHDALSDIKATALLANEIMGRMIDFLIGKFGGPAELLPLVSDLVPPAIDETCQLCGRVDEIPF